METKIPLTANGKPMYVIVKDGNNQELKIVNFENDEMVPNKGIKIIKAIKRSSRHQPASVCRVHRDKITGIIYGIPAGISEITKSLRFQSIEINDIREYDLSVLQDRMEWSVVSRAQFLQGSPFQKGKPTHVLYDVEADAIAKVESINEKKLAYATMEGLSQLQILDMARNCGGINVLNNSPSVITAELYEFIDSKEPNKGAKKFNQIWKASNREVVTIFNRCKAVGLVSFDLNSGWLWKGATQLGTTEPTAIDSISKNHSLLVAMDSESKSMDKEYDKAATAEEKSVIISALPVNSAPNNEILAQLQKRMDSFEAKEKEVDALLAKLKSAESVNVSNNFDLPPVLAVETLTPAPEELSGQVKTDADSELVALRQHAKAQGMKHAHLPTITKEAIEVWLRENKKA